MKIARVIFLAFLAGVGAALKAADDNVSGLWKFTQAGRGGGQGAERTLKLELKDGKITGILKGFSTGQFEVPDAPITDGSFKDGHIAFTVTTEINGNKRTLKYEAKLDGEKLIGNFEAPGRDGAAQKRDWTAYKDPFPVPQPKPNPKQPPDKK